jgi:hypothetical protein
MDTMTNASAFQDFFEPRLLTCPRVTVGQSQYKFVEDFVSRLWKDKIDEYPWDAKNIIERNIIGRLCEYAFLSAFRKEAYFDDSIGKSTDYTTPDLWHSPRHKKQLPNPLIPSDIKSSRFGNTPLVEKQLKSVVVNGVRHQCPNIICVSDYKTVWFLGIASPTILKTHSTVALIKNAKNDRKTAFYGADKLVAIPPTWDELRKTCEGLLEKST